MHLLARNKTNNRDIPPITLTRLRRHRALLSNREAFDTFALNLPLYLVFFFTTRQRLLYRLNCFFFLSSSLLSNEIENHPRAQQHFLFSLYFAVVERSKETKRKILRAKNFFFSSPFNYSWGTRVAASISSAAGRVNRP